MPVVATGAELKNSVCVLQGDVVTLTEPVGDLSEADNCRSFLRTLTDAVESLPDGPIVLAHDLHPAFTSTVTARNLANEREQARCEPVQHHHAHVTACMAEHSLTEPVIGIACDGTGYGTDGTIWGGEVLYVTPARFERCAYIQPFASPGGDAAARQTWRPALSLVHQAFGAELPDHVRSLFTEVPEGQVRPVQTMLRRGVNAPLTSSLGRLFDGVAFLAGVCTFNEFEGQAAIRLQEAAEGAPGDPYQYHLAASDGDTEGTQLVVSEMVREICTQRSKGVESSVVAGRFHATIAAMFSAAALAAARRFEVSSAVLTGGCFLNSIFAGRTRELLTQGGAKTVYQHERFSPGDVSLGLGQAYTAAARMNEVA